MHDSMGGPRGVFFLQFAWSFCDSGANKNVSKAEAEYLIEIPRYFAESHLYLGNPMVKMSKENKKIFECQVCKRELFVTPNQFFNHHQYHRKNFQCNICQKTFPIKALLEKHMKDAHNTQDEIALEGEKIKYEYTKCDICDEQLSKNSIKHHKAMSHGDGKCLQCEFCNKTFSSKAVLMKHKKGAHSQDKPYKCEICGKGFPFSERLSRHINGIHEKIKRFKCELCEKSFFAKKDLERHVFIHSKLKPYQCET